MIVPQCFPGLIKQLKLLIWYEFFLAFHNYYDNITFGGKSKESKFSGQVFPFLMLLY